MKDILPINEDRKKRIESSMKAQEEDAKRDGKSLETDRVIVQGKVKRLPIYQFQTNELVYNRANGRIKSEIFNKESSLGRILKDDLKEDQDIFREILSSISQLENQKISKDIYEKGQLKPGIITCDGIVINGNRRKAILENLYSEHEQEERLKYIECQVLPRNIKKSELWLIEAGIQMSAEQQLDYSPINNMLKFKEGINSGLTPSEMASRIYGVQGSDIEEDLERLSLIDEYLEEFLEKKNRYYLVDGLNEHFINLQKILAWAKKPRGPTRIDWNFDSSDVNELKLVIFYYIRLKIQHLRIRDMKELFGRKLSWDELRRTLDIDIRDDYKVTPIDEEDEYFTEEESDVSNSGAFSDAQIQSDKIEEKNWINQAKSELKGNFQDSKEQNLLQKDSVKPAKLARRALKAINAIPETDESLINQELDDLLSDIIKKVNGLRKKIKKLSG